MNTLACVLVNKRKIGEQIKTNFFVLKYFYCSFLSFPHGFLLSLRIYDWNSNTLEHYTLVTRLQFCSGLDCISRTVRTEGVLRVFMIGHSELVMCVYISVSRLRPV